jgi:hypothetical protein
MDIAPYREPRTTIRVTTREITDTVDTVAGFGQNVADSVSGSGSGSSSLPYILGGILAVLVGLGFLIFMVRLVRRKGEQALSLQSQRL